MQEIEHGLDLFTKYGITTIIAFIAVWIALDLYLLAKKKWLPAFLDNFSVIATNVRGLNESLKSLSEALAQQSSRIDTILLNQKDGFEMIASQMKTVNGHVADLQNIATS